MRHSLQLVTVAHPDGDFTFHLVVRDDGRPVKMRLGGWWGKPNSNDVQPFILKPDGRMDFGVLPEDHIEYHREGRYGSTDILEHRVVVGERVEIDVDEQQFVVPITAVEDLLGSGPRAKLPA